MAFCFSEVVHLYLRKSRFHHSREKWMFLEAGAAQCGYAWLFLSPHDEFRSSTLKQFAVDEMILLPQDCFVCP